MHVYAYCKEQTNAAASENDRNQNYAIVRRVQGPNDVGSRNPESNCEHYSINRCAEFGTRFKLELVKHLVTMKSAHGTQSKKKIPAVLSAGNNVAWLTNPQLGKLANIFKHQFRFIKLSGPISDPILELVVDKNTLHIEPHGTALRREHVAGELERHGGGDEGQSSELDLTWHIPVGGGC